MVRKLGYILAMLLISISLFGEDSTFVFRINHSDDFFYTTYKGNDTVARALSVMISKNLDKIDRKEFAFMISGEKSVIESVQSYFVIYEGLSDEFFTYSGEETSSKSEEDYIIEITIYDTGYEKEVIRRKKRKALSYNKIEFNYIPEIAIERGKVRPWVDEFASTQKPVFLIKTNLLTDAAITPNIEFDFPVAKHLSIAAYYSYGWWLRRDNTFCWQIQYGGVEFKYWINEHRESFNPMTKWYAGAFYNLGIYDFQFKQSEGVQGDFNVFAGFTGGYVYTVKPGIRFDFSFGVGFFSTVYQKYFTFENVIIKSGSPVRLNTAMPKAKISLSFVIFKHIRKGGRL